MTKVDLSKYDNSFYKPGSYIRIIFWILISAVFFRTSIPFPSRLKIFLLRLFGASVGKGVVIKQNVNIKYPWFLTILDNCWIGENVWIDNLVNVHIGNSCCLSQGCYILTGNHDFTSQTFDLIVSPVIIYDEVWIGAKSIVCPGVTIMKGVVLTVGSVATKNLDEFGIYKGNPSIKVKERIIV